MVLDNVENEVLTNQIYDIYVVKTSGIPLFAGCTATDYCMRHMGNHELVSGFFSAMFSFSEESFDEEKLETMIYGNIRLNFWKDEEHGLIFAFVHDRASDNTHIREQLKQAHDVFIEKFHDHLDDFLVDQSVFQDYRKHLGELGIIGNKLVDTSEMVKNVEQNNESSGIISWFRGLFK